MGIETLCNVFMLMRRLLFLTYCYKSITVKCPWNKMPLAELNVDIPRASIAGATERKARWAWMPSTNCKKRDGYQLYASSGFLEHSFVP